MKSSIKQIVLSTIELGAGAIAGLSHYINEGFEKAVRVIADCKGSIVFSGMRKKCSYCPEDCCYVKFNGQSFYFRSCRPW